ncbi:DUF6247 family protein [Embleya scabrispora]|uniref:DUF6247 family protein n=1 Tax=Embleya scabrispora TaxID=159449 RepID=UPI000380AA66|nr:DUF6247 family protein [Embleya scabrispora]MYS83177.1 hypothetical protein [Streptomyces sp. SID5474]
MDETTDPRWPQRTIGFGGPEHATPAELRAELPDDLRMDFEEEYQDALAEANANGNLLPLAEMLPGWQGKLARHRATHSEPEQPSRRLDIGPAGDHTGAR